MMLSLFYPYEYVESVFTIDYERLYKNGIRGLIFDIDNTLVHHGDDSTPEIDALFVDIGNMGFKTLLLSNNNEARVKRFMKNIDVLYVCDADKPDIKGYLKAVDMLCLDKKEIVVVGDQVFTDVLGANRCGLASILVHFIRLDSEKRIGKRRQAERLILKSYKLRKSKCNRLGGIEKTINQEK